ncbi:MAG: hypothetical protein LBG64_01510 [Pseudomonadales bacterium]|jgi:hypothetical protein|nr:hypothetical protein [Pseudomonadales bacterium]
MDRLINKLKSDHGMGVMEIMIVATIIIVLVLLFVWFVNPAEIFRRSRDTRNSSQSRELVAALVRYNIVTSTYPWLVNNASFQARMRRGDGSFEHSPHNPEDSLEWMWNLIDEGEMNNSAVRRYIDANNLYIIKPRAQNDVIYACFEPEAEVNIIRAAQNCDETIGGIHGRVTPRRVNEVEPCDTIDGSLPIRELGERNLLCITH